MPASIRRELKEEIAIYALGKKDLELEAEGTAGLSEVWPGSAEVEIGVAG